MHIRHTDEQLIKRINNDFTYHKPPLSIIKDLGDLRGKAKELAHLINALVPSGREKESALTRLEEAIFHANAGIARQYPERAQHPLLSEGLTKPQYPVNKV